MCVNKGAHAQSRQSAKLFLKSLELGLPHPLTRRRVCLPPVLGGAHSLAREGLGGSQFRRGDIHCGSLYIYLLCGHMAVCTSVQCTVCDESVCELTKLPSILYKTPNTHLSSLVSGICLAGTA